MDPHSYSSSPPSPSDAPPHSITRYPSSSSDGFQTQGYSLGHGIPTPHGPLQAPPPPQHSNGQHSHQHQPQSHTQPGHGHGHGHGPGSYIHGSILPPNTDPSDVDFRAFYPYVPNEVKHRKRTTRAQLRTLEETFKIKTKPELPLRNKLAEELQMTPRAVQVWFQNRRAKQKTIAKRREAAGKGGIIEDRGSFSEDDEDDCGVPTNYPDLNNINTGAFAESPGQMDDSGSATPPPLSTQPSPLDARPQHGFPMPSYNTGSIGSNGLSGSDLYDTRRPSLPLSAMGMGINHYQPIASLYGMSGMPSSGPASISAGQATQAAQAAGLGGIGSIGGGGDMSMPNQVSMPHLGGMSGSGGFNPGAPFSAAAGPSLSLTDAAGRRRSVDESLHRLASHPYAHIAKAANGVLYGPRASIGNGQIAGVAESVRAAGLGIGLGNGGGGMQGPMGAMAMGMQNARKASMPQMGRAHQLPQARGHGLGLGPGLQPPPVPSMQPMGMSTSMPGPSRPAGLSNRTRLLDYSQVSASASAPMRTLPPASTGPLPSPTYSFGVAGATLPQESASGSGSGGLEQLNSFSFPPRDDGPIANGTGNIIEASNSGSGSSSGSTVNGNGYSQYETGQYEATSYTVGNSNANPYTHRFGSIAESESSVTSTGPFYSHPSDSSTSIPSIAVSGLHNQGQAQYGQQQQQQQQSHNQHYGQQQQDVAPQQFQAMNPQGQAQESWINASMPTGFSPATRKDSCASVNDAFFGLAMSHSHPGSQEDLSAYFGGANMGMGIHGHGNELVGLPATAHPISATTTVSQAAYDEALSRRGSIAIPGPAASGSGVGTADQQAGQSGLGLGRWPPVPHMNGMTEAPGSRRQSVDASSMGFNVGMMHTVSPPMLAASQGQGNKPMGYAQSHLAFAPSPETGRSVSAGSGSDGSPGMDQQHQHQQHQPQSQQQHQNQQQGQDHVQATMQHHDQSGYYDLSTYTFGNVNSGTGTAGYEYDASAFGMTGMTSADLAALGVSAGMDYGMPAPVQVPTAAYT